MNPYRIYLSPPYLAPRARQYLQEAIESGWIAPVGPFIERFEQLLEDYHGVYAVALNAGTAALHLALHAVGVSYGDAVIIPSFTFVATYNAVRHAGAVPVLVDSEADSWHMSPEATEEAIRYLQKQGKKVGALLLVHLYGQMAKVSAFVELSHRYQIPLVEDAAEALGARYDGKLAGSFGLTAALSFNGNKLVTTGGGGALLTRQPALAHKVRYWATQAKSITAEGEIYHEEVGYNYRLSNLLAALGCAQMEYLPKLLERKRQIAYNYRQLLSGLPQLNWQPTLKEVEPTFWLNNLLCQEVHQRLQIEKQLLACGIECRRLWKPLHLQPVARGDLYFSNGEIAAQLYAHGLSLPSGHQLSESQQEQIASLVKKALIIN